MKLATMLPLLRCPHSGGTLAVRGDTLVSSSGHVYPLVAGKPVLVRTIREWHLTPPPPEKVSQNIASYKPCSPAIRAGSVILHLGSGNVPADNPRVISCDVLPCPHVDVVCEGESLPFADGCIDYVESGAVFEHVHDPWAAIAEVKRVLAPGGEFSIDTAFMQSYHGFPSHYYNMTPQAVETDLVGACELRQACVPASATPLMTVVMAMDRYLGFVSEPLRRRLLDTRLGDVLDEMRRDVTPASPLLADFDDYANRCLTASYVVVGRKQREHDACVAAIAAVGPAALDGWRTLLREYYALRLELMQRHHEIGYYRRKAAEKAAPQDGIDEPEPLAAALAACVPASMFEAAALEEALRGGRRWEQAYRAVRDAWIARYLAAGGT
jgi:SAM-dependent methyltransferase